MFELEVRRDSHSGAGRVMHSRNVMIQRGRKGTANLENADCRRNDRGPQRAGAPGGAMRSVQHSIDLDRQQLLERYDPLSLTRLRARLRCTRCNAHAPTVMQVWDNRARG